MRQRVLVELSPTLDAGEWARLHATGQVPDRVPYGLDRLADEGLSVLVRTPPRSQAISQLSRVGAKLTGGARWPESVFGRPYPSADDTIFCWDERAGIPAVLAHAGRRRRPPVVTGVIWNTEPDARLSGLSRSMSRAALRRADAVFVLSSGQLAGLRTDWGIDSARVHLIHFGIDTDFWNPSLSTGAAPELVGRTILSVGNDRYRDHRIILAAMRNAHAKLPEIRLELVTSTPYQIPAEVGRWRQSVTHPELRELYSKAQVVAICTRPNTHASGITSILEAMAMGKPVVATRTEGLEDYVAHEETGILVSAGDPDAMTQVLVELVTDPDRCARLGAAARERALSYFSTQALSQRLAAVIRSVV